MTFKSILYFMKNVCLHNVGTIFIIRLAFKQKIKLRTSMAFKFPLHKMKKVASFLYYHSYIFYQKDVLERKKLKSCREGQSELFVRSCRKNFFNNLIVVKFGTAKFINKYLKDKNSHHSTQNFNLKIQILIDFTK